MWAFFSLTLSQLGWLVTPLKQDIDRLIVDRESKHLNKKFLGYV